MCRVYLLLWLLALSSSLVQAKALEPGQVPEPLQPWIGWVLQGEEVRNCPFLFNNGEQHYCAWPARLKLDLKNGGGRFEQSLQVFQESWITLPGSDRHWPQKVRLNDKLAAVAIRAGRPSIQLSPGRHTLSGKFIWERIPESLLVANDTGLVALKINGRQVRFPELDQQGRLWLREQDSGETRRKGESDRLGIQVYRKVTDDLPMQITTRIELDISGTQRELVLGTALLPETIPLRLQSPLPARLESDGSLRVQVRPGHWVLELIAREPGEVTALRLPANSKPWPKTEIWVFEARNALRLVELSGLTSIDPRQTRLPVAWQKLPAYRVFVDEALQIKVIRRGDPEPEPDKLRLVRNLWLDFDGRGYTLKDEISGSMTRGWRLEVVPAIALGRVAIDGQPQFITALPDSEQKGVEVRRGAIQLVADSRIDEGIRRVPAVGWDKDFQQVRATLHLPPGWELFASTGVDNVPNTWLQRWTLLDIFIVLITALAIGRLWGWSWGTLGLLTLALIWHEPGIVPRFVWINVLLAIALLRVIPPGKLQRAVRWYRHLSLLSLILIAIPFLVEEVRTGLFPQLEQPTRRFALVSDEVYLASPAPVSQEALPQTAGVEKARPYRERRKLMRSQLDKSLAYTQIDPKVTVQTGPGLPAWQWNSVRLEWNGPVARDQELGLILLPPVVNMLLNFLRTILVAMLILLMLDFRYVPGQGWRHGAAVACLLLGMPMLLLGSGEARAEFPDGTLLEELKTRLLEPPDCLPLCAQSPRLRLEATANTLRLRVEIHTQQDVAVPLPAHAQQWLPQQVLLNGRPARGLLRSRQGELWLALKKGHHQVILSGPMPPRSSFQLPLLLKPQRVDYTHKGWTLEGVDENGRADPQLQLTRVRDVKAQTAAASLEPGTLPPFVRIERTLRLGLDWRVETRVVRVSPPGSAIVLEVPLLAGESVLTEGIRIRNGQAQINLSARQSQLAWQSSLEKRIAIKLLAPATTEWTEIWRVDVSPIWHLEMDGIPVVHHQDPGGNWLPEWRPWPGEQLLLNVRRPQGVAGQTLTIDESQLNVKPGRRVTDSSLQLRLRSSQGGQHTLRLPENAELQSVNINAIPQPIRQDGRNVTLPLQPGVQQVLMQWREPRGIGTMFSAPRVDLAAPSVNASINLQLGKDRWLLFTAGPRLGPAVLFWGVLIVIAGLAFGLARLPLAPLNFWHWFLLGLGLSQATLEMALLVVAWLLALGARERIVAQMSAKGFNLIQIGLAFLTLLAMFALLFAIQNGLLGYPDMQVAGNQSYAGNLNWYQDRVAGELPQPWVLSVPLLVYRLLMLAWALWLAFALLRWLRWGWVCFSSAGLWRPRGTHAVGKASDAEQDQPQP